MAEPIRTFYFRESLNAAFLAVANSLVIERRDGVRVAASSLSRERHLTPLMPDLSDRASREHGRFITGC
jgi:hypothetical protein